MTVSRLPDNSNIVNPPFETATKPPFDYKKFLIKVQGQQDYLPVAGRLVWFREDHPDWGISTEIVTYDMERKYAVVRASIVDSNGKLIAQGTKQEDAKGFGDYLEKAETGAVGRALAYAGFGTQFAKELAVIDRDGVHRVCDAPIGSKAKPLTPAEQSECTEISARIIKYLDSVDEEKRNYTLGYLDYREWSGKVQDLPLDALREYDEWISGRVAAEAKADEGPTPSNDPPATSMSKDDEKAIRESSERGRLIREVNGRLGKLTAEEKSLFKTFASAAFSGVFRPVDMTAEQLMRSNQALDDLAADPFVDLAKTVETSGKGHGKS